MTRRAVVSPYRRFGGTPPADLLLNSATILELVERVRPIVSQHARRTPLLRSEWLSSLLGGEVYLKCENLQVTGSFKIRGAVAALSQFPDHLRAKGVCASSAGNHGQALALAAQIFGAPCAIAVPQSVPRVKEEAIRMRGATVVRSPYDGYDDTQAWVHEHPEMFPGTFISPFDEPEIMAGNGGTMALEIMEDLPDLETIVIPVGGGGCAVGAGVVVKARAPETRVVGVNTDASPGMWLSRRDGKAYLKLDSKPTIAEGLEGGVSETTFELGKSCIDEMVLAKEATIREAVANIVRNERMIVEGSGAAGVAALLDGKVQAKRVCVVVTGGNIDTERLVELLSGEVGEGGARSLKAPR